MKFITFSPREEDYENIEKYFLDVFKSDGRTLFAVKQYGKRGNHPHIHFTYDTSQRGCDWKRKHIRALAKLNVLNTPNLIDFRNVTTLQDTIKYMLSEETAEIIVDNSGLTEDTLNKLRKASKTIRVMNKWKLIPNIVNYPIVFIEYYVSREFDPKDFTYEKYMKVQDDMEEEGIPFHHLRQARSNQDVPQVYLTIKNLLSRLENENNFLDI